VRSRPPPRSREIIAKPVGPGGAFTQGRRETREAPTINRAEELSIRTPSVLAPLPVRLTLAPPAQRAEGARRKNERRGVADAERGGAELPGFWSPLGWAPLLILRKNAEETGKAEQPTAPSDGGARRGSAKDRTERAVKERAALRRGRRRRRRLSAIGSSLQRGRQLQRNEGEPGTGPSAPKGMFPPGPPPSGSVTHAPVAPHRQAEARQ